MTLPPRLFELHPSSGVPIYRQLVEQVRAMVAGGKLRSGDLLPSVRQVAQAAEINPMTVSKAYSRLETEGLVERVRGQGMRVRPPMVTGRLAERKSLFAELLAPALHRARQLGLTTDQIRGIFDTLLDDLEPIPPTREGTRR
jgi:GntR family transcriptional regulator